MRATVNPPAVGHSSSQLFSHHSESVNQQHVKMDQLLGSLTALTQDRERLKTQLLVAEAAASTSRTDMSKRASSPRACSALHSIN